MRLFIIFFIVVLSICTLHAVVIDRNISATGENFVSPDLDEEFEDEFDKFEEEYIESKKEEFDPLSGYNIIMTEFNDAFYTNILFPVARGYRYVVPEGGRLAVSRFFDNLFFPVRFINNILQFKLLNSAEELGRFAINSTIGLFGLFDPAKEWFGLESHDEDFGQTLGYYGVGDGFHIVIPLLGPSNLRDAIGMTIDWKIDPLIYQSQRNYNMINRMEDAIMIRAYDYLNDGSFNIEEYESLKRDAVELYPFFKNVYKQSRKKKIEE